MRYTINQIVWAKCIDYPWWPAFVTHIYRYNKRLCYKVTFFGSNWTSYVYVKQMCPYQSKVFSFLSQYIDPELKYAIKCADRALKRSFNVE